MKIITHCYVKCFANINSLNPFNSMTLILVFASFSHMRKLTHSIANCPNSHLKVTDGRTQAVQH